jgi:PRC-barrel domain.
MNKMIKAGVLAGTALFVSYGIAMADSGMSTHKLGGTLTMTNGMLRTSGLDGATIYNNSGKDVGTLKNILMSDSGGAPMAVASADGRMVSFPFSKLKFEKSDPKSTAKNPDYSVVYPGATTAKLKAMPKFHYDSGTAD